LEVYLSEYKDRIKNSSLYKVLGDYVDSITKYFNFPTNFTLVAFHFIQQNNRIFKPQKVFSIRTLPTINYSNNWNVLTLDLKNFENNGYTVILSAPTNEQSVRLSAYLENNGIRHGVFQRVALATKSQVNIVNRKIPYSITLPEEKLAVIGYTSLFGKPKKIIETDTSFFDGEVPNENDYVVHSVHGVGRCLGVKALQISGSIRDYVVIEYKNSAKVYLPVENLNQLSKYIGSDKTPTINKIGGVEFAKTKAKVKSAVKRVAFDLIALYRDRLNLKGLKYREDDDMQREFESSFGFSETADQIKAIDACKEDLESGKVMDRLVCGVVGFGKTEVALRIAFKTILNGKQVAFLCPTTILSEQHYNTAKSRMANFGVKIEVLNRLRSKKDVERIKKDFASGKIDLLCGTHKLLASDIDYKNLGLLVLDEEQKFGVADKEKIKNIRKSVNVLTLSATPIPRTLNMSLIGVRDISVIETPPTERLPSDVQVVEYSDNLVKTALTRELDRGGQALVIFNRVEGIYDYASKVKTLVPNAIVSVAHGQMKSEELEKEIYNLYTGETQILVATTLIENGVDLPNANTLIVIDSDMLGLSQLYQLKGRIGRSDKYSYAYFTFSNRNILTDNGYKRLQAIKEFSELGSGFKIAMRDLEIRGAGSLLGAEQSGHIEKIGYNMYVELLNESVKELRGEKIDKRTDIRVETNIPAYLPHDYIESTARRMSVYKDISNIDTTDKLDKLKDNLENVYGNIPEELMSIMKIALIKNNLSKIGVSKVVLKSLSLITFESKEYISKKVIDLVHEFADRVSLKVADSPVLEIRIEKCENILDYMIKISRLLGDF
jgi:transcription-repair coupling factor (superfamily II helicase)